MTNACKDYLNSIQKELKNILNQNGAVISQSHLVLTSGKHSDGYINLRKLGGKTEEHITIGAYLGNVISLQTKESESLCNEDPIIIVGPETMGRSFAHEASYACRHLIEQEYRANYVWCEPNADKTAMQWNSKLEFAAMVAGQHCFVVDDVLTTAKTLSQTIKLIRDTGGIVDGVVVVIRRDPEITAEVVGVPWLIALYEVDLQSYEPDTCPLCQQKIPMRLHPGHGHEWIKDHPDYPNVD